MTEPSEARNTAAGSSAAHSPAHFHVSNLGGYLEIAGAALCWGFCAGLAKFLFARGLGIQAGPLVLAQVRISFSFLVLLAIALAWRRPMLRANLRDAGGLAVLGLFGIVASTYGYLVAIDRTTVATAIVLQYTAPIWVVLYTSLLGGERLTRRRLLATALSFGGCVMAVGGYGLSGFAWSGSGVAWGMVSAFSYSFFTIWGARMARRVALWTSLLYSLGATTLFWAVVHPPARLLANGYTAGQWAILFSYAMLSVLIPYALFYRGLKHLRPANVIVTSTLEPVFAIVFAFLLVGERLVSLQFLGMACVLAAVVLVASGNRARA